MAWVIKCERCGKYFDWQSDETSGFAFLTYDHVKNRYNIDGEEYDLCPECVIDLYGQFSRKENHNAID